MNKIKVTF